MSQKILSFISIGAVALVYALNLTYAHNNYGILEDNLSPEVLA